MPDNSRTITVTTRREPFRTEIEHRADGSLLARQHCCMVTRDQAGTEIGREDRYITIELRSDEVPADDLAAVERVLALFATKPDPMTIQD